MIVQPGAYGTTFLAHSPRAQRDVTSQYGRTARLFEAFGHGFEERARAARLGDPREVIAPLVEELDRNAGERPLRHTVGNDGLEPVTAINRTCDQVQGQLLRAFGLKERPIAGVHVAGVHGGMNLSPREGAT